MFAGVVSVLAWGGLWVLWFVTYRRAMRWESVARAAATDARIWRNIAREARTANALSKKRTVVAPQYHSPRVG